uniref:Homeodomain interacting protein kinase 4 n=1 Tax=Anser brachyrhynchus TaxID=132585 RepID=A0A8B9BUV3_9AVES
MWLIYHQAPPDTHPNHLGKGRGEAQEGRKTAGGVAALCVKLLRALQAVDTEAAHIVRFLESFQDSACTYLVFELLEQSLFEFQKKNNFSPLPVRHIRTIMAQVLVALAKLKELAIIHGDLKPENIMLVDHARHPFHVKLVDFGSACIFSEVCFIKEPYIQTRFYRAPEILLGLPFCEKMDMWSLGCVVAELHLGRPLYPGRNEDEQVRYICKTQGLPPGRLLCTARKAQRFFRRAPDPAGAWQLKPEVMVVGAKVTVERRRYILSSLEQMVAVNVQPLLGARQEVLAERCDLHGMVELVQRMLTWDSHERIAPSTALKHPFISMRQLESSFQATQYYQLCQQATQASREDAAGAAATPTVEEGIAFPPEEHGYCSVKRATTQMDNLSLGEESQHGACHPIPCHYGSWHRAAQHPQRRKRNTVSGNLIVLGPRSPPGDVARWQLGAEHARGSVRLAPCQGTTMLQLPEQKSPAACGEDHGEAGCPPAAHGVPRWSGVPRCSPWRRPRWSRWTCTDGGCGLWKTPAGADSGPDL